MRAALSRTANSEVGAAPYGENSIAHFKHRLRPFFTLQQPIEGLLRTVPEFAGLHVYCPLFWQRSRKGALLQECVRIVAAPVRDKGLGRLQLTLWPDGSLVSA